MSNNTIALRHERYKGDKVVNFYDGLLFAKDGLLTIPLDRPLWIQNAFLKGWRITPDGVKLFNRYQLDAEIAKQTEPELTAKSAEDKNEAPIPAAKPKRTNKSVD